MTENIKKQIYYVNGMHCASCEILIEKKILELENIISAKASAAKGKIEIEYNGKIQSVEKLNEIFRNHGYFFSERPIKINNNSKLKNALIYFGIALLFIFGFLALNKSGLSAIISVDSKSSSPIFFIFGLLAGTSTCAALVGGLILSMSKQWNSIYSANDSTLKKIHPHLFFNAGRIISYSFFGVLLGIIGNRLILSTKFSAILVITVSIIMFFLALQMLGFKKFRYFQITMPKFLIRYIANKSNFKNRFMPFLIGASTFFLPCGFTLTAQGMALLSGNATQGFLIMTMFALGTLPALALIGFSSVKFLNKPHSSEKFLKIAGILVLFFAIYNINSQLNALQIASISDLNAKTNQYLNIISNESFQKKFPEIINGKQIIKMNASSSGYSPNYFYVKVGIPVRWEIADKGTSGCTNAIISNKLFDGEIYLTKGQTSVKEFTPTKTGKYKFSCWMGMVSGIIEVADESDAEYQN